MSIDFRLWMLSGMTLSFKMGCPRITKSDLFSFCNSNNLIRWLGYTSNLPEILEIKCKPGWMMIIEWLKNIWPKIVCLKFDRMSPKKLKAIPWCPCPGHSLTFITIWRAEKVAVVEPILMAHIPNLRAVTLFLPTHVTLTAVCCRVYNYWRGCLEGVT